MTGLFNRESSYWVDPHGVGARMRDEAAVHVGRLPNGVRVWTIGRHADARAALTDGRLSKNAARLAAIVGAQLAEAGHGSGTSVLFTPHMLFSDGLDHARLRRLVAGAFTRRRMADLAPRVREVAAALVDRLATRADEGAVVDLVAEFAFPLPLVVICELLGVPDRDREALRGWTTALVEEDPDTATAASLGMAGYVTDLIADKRAHPGEDLISALVSYEQDDDRLDAEELLATIVLLIVAGHETVTSLIGNGVVSLLAPADPVQWRSLAACPEMAPRVVDELLRVEGAVRHGTYRYTTEPVAYGGMVIPEGEVVLVSLISANRDPQVFPEPDEFRLDRPEIGKHLAFGHGMHRCLGALLGKLEAEEALGRLAARFPNARLAAPVDLLRRTRSPITIGYAEVPVHLHP